MPIEPGAMKALLGHGVGTPLAQNVEALQSTHAVPLPPPLTGL
jgi:hypothetical protein